MTVPTLSRAERKRVERDLYADIRRRFDAELPKKKKRYSDEEAAHLAAFLTDRTTAVMIGLIREAMEATPGVTGVHIDQVMGRLKERRGVTAKMEGPILRKAVLDTLAKIQMTIMLETVEHAVQSLDAIKGIGPRRHEMITTHIARLLRENS